MKPITVLLVMLAVAVLPADGQQEKLAQTGMKFLSVSVDPRAAGLGDALTAVEHGSASMFYNPAGMAWQSSSIDLTLGRTQWIAEIDYSLGSFSFRPRQGRWGVIGFTLLAVDYGELEETIRFDNEQGYLDVGTFSPSAWSFGAGYARALTDQFAIGAQIKWANQYLGSSVMGYDADGEYARERMEELAVAYDFGMLYKTGFRSLQFAVSARNFARELSFAEESFQLPLTLRIGVSMDMFDMVASMSDRHSWLVSVDASNPRDFSEQIKVGTEYRFLGMFSLRAGYAFPTDEQGVSLGLGLKQGVGPIGFGADYSFTDFGIFSSVHRLALRLSI